MEVENYCCSCFKVMEKKRSVEEKKKRIWSINGIFSSWSKDNPQDFVFLFAEKCSKSKFFPPS